MANVERLIANLKNRIAESVGEGGRSDLGDGRKVTWGWCNDKRYPSPRYKFVSVTGPDVHQSGIYDTDSGRFVT